MGVTLSLALVGSDDEPRWAALVKYLAPGGPGVGDGRFCCDGGHWTPEAAAAHGLEVAMARLIADARSLAPPTAGGEALRRAAA